MDDACLETHGKPTGVLTDSLSRAVGNLWRQELCLDSGVMRIPRDAAPPGMQGAATHNMTVGCHIYIYICTYTYRELLASVGPRIRYQVPGPSGTVSSGYFSRTEDFQKPPMRLCEPPPGGLQGRRWGVLRIRDAWLRVHAAADPDFMSHVGGSKDQWTEVEQRPQVAGLLSQAHPQPGALLYGHSRCSSALLSTDLYYAGPWPKQTFTTEAQ